jgi:hypothetical protein
LAWPSPIIWPLDFFFVFFHRIPCLILQHHFYWWTSDIESMYRTRIRHVSNPTWCDFSADSQPKEFFGAFWLSNWMVPSCPFLIAFKMTSIIVTPQKDAEQVGHLAIQEKLSSNYHPGNFFWHLFLGLLYLK